MSTSESSNQHHISRLAIITIGLLKFRFLEAHNFAEILQHLQQEKKEFRLE